MQMTKILLPAVCLLMMGYYVTEKSLTSTPLTAQIAARIDSDGDGVADPQDRCPNTAAGILVGPNGCPITGGGTAGDLDGDGVPNELDQCPGTPVGATVNGFGCTIPGSGNPGTGSPQDLDGDGVVNEFDECPNTPDGVIVHANGCPVE